MDTSSAAALEATFTGTATVTTSYGQARGPYTQPLEMGLAFNDTRTAVHITSFPVIKTEPFSTPFGSNVTTITKTGGGSGTSAGGAITMPLRLKFDHSIDLPFFQEHSTLDVVLSADSPGSPVDPGGAVKLVGSGTFQGGLLNGSTGSLTIDGTITPVP
jgi:hypothetical protein